MKATPRPRHCCRACCAIARRNAARLRRIDELWKLHQYPPPAPAVDGRCLVFLLDGRYVEGTDWPDARVRVAVSFGRNPFSWEMRLGPAVFPILPGKFIFGLHLVAQKGQRLALYNEWSDGRRSGDCRDAVSARARGVHLLSSIPDDEYLMMAGAFLKNPVLIHDHSPKLWELKIVREGTL